MSIPDPDLSGHIRQLQQLYDQGLLSEANFRGSRLWAGHGLSSKTLECPNPTPLFNAIAIRAAAVDVWPQTER